jgi:predicted nucleic acid-binding protein
MANAKEYVADTMALVLWLEKRSLPVKVAKIFEEALQDSTKYIIWIPAIVLAEIGYLSEKERIEITLSEVIDFINATSGVFRLMSMDALLVEKAFKITDVPELHDRLIAGGALLRECPVLTNDPKLENSAFVHTIWK